MEHAVLDESLQEKEIGTARVPLCPTPHFKQECRIFHGKDGAPERRGGLDGTETKHGNIHVGIARIVHSNETLGTVFDDEELVSPCDLQDLVDWMAGAKNMGNEYHFGVLEDESTIVSN